MSLLPANLPPTFAAYAAHHQLNTIWQELLQKLILYKPDDPISFLVTEIKRPVRSEVIVVGMSLGGANKVAKEIAARFNCLHISSSALLHHAIDTKHASAPKAKEMMEQEQLVADDIVCALLAEKLKSEAVQQQGYVLTGAPRTRTQAREMIRTGFMPKHVIYLLVILDTQDARVYENAAHYKYDPIKNEHIDLNTEHDPTILNRSSIRTKDFPENIKIRLAEYRARLPGILESFPKAKTFDPADLEGIIKWCTRSQSKYTGTWNVSVYDDTAPKVAEALGAIYVSPRTLIGSEQEQQTSADQNEDDQIITLLKKRISQADVSSKGFVLHGYPNSPDAMLKLKASNIGVSRIIITSRTDAGLAETLKTTYGIIKPGSNLIRGFAQTVTTDSNDVANTERIVEALRRGIDMEL